MTITAKVSQRGQVAIPRKMRSRYGIRDGVTLVFEDREDGLLIHPVKDFLSFRGALKRPRVSVEKAIDESVREGMECE